MVPNASAPERMSAQWDPRTRLQERHSCPARTLPSNRTGHHRCRDRDRGSQRARQHLERKKHSRHRLYSHHHRLRYSLCGWCTLRHPRGGGLIPRPSGWTEAAETPQRPADRTLVVELIGRRSQLYWCSDATQGDACVGAASSGGVASAPERRQPTRVELLAFALRCRRQWNRRLKGKGRTPTPSSRAPLQTHQARLKVRAPAPGTFAADGVGE